MFPSSSSVSRQLAAVLALLEPALDIVRGRVVDAAPPAWCERRGWTEFLLELSDAELAQAEERGLASLPGFAQRAPSELVAWLAELARATRVTRLASDTQDTAGAQPWRGVGERKRAQLAAMLSAVAPLAGAAPRIVDFGSGRGHFSRLAADLFQTDVLGLERSAERVARAEHGAPLAAGRARFLRLDLSAEAFALDPNDLAFGLHACGELGDRMVRAAGAARCDAVLVSCCAQKISTRARRGLSRAFGELELERDVLGLSNLSTRAQGVETSLRATLRAREARYALAVLLQARGIALAPGEEMHGVNRRRAHGDFAAVAGRVCAARGLGAPSEPELARAEARAREEFARVRRLSLPRNALARLLELAIVLDRAQSLVEVGLSVCIAQVFDAEVTPRNLGLFASRDGARLPALASQNERMSGG